MRRLLKPSVSNWLLLSMSSTEDSALGPSDEPSAAAAPPVGESACAALCLRGESLATRLKTAALLAERDGHIRWNKEAETDKISKNRSQSRVRLQTRRLRARNMTTATIQMRRRSRL
eukprot:1926686-Pleurochrysis_carterae.AAC.3